MNLNYDRLIKNAAEKGINYREFGDPTNRPAPPPGTRLTPLKPIPHQPH